MSFEELSSITDEYNSIMASMGDESNILAAMLSGTEDTEALGRAMRIQAEFRCELFQIIVTANNLELARMFLLEMDYQMHLSNPGTEKSLLIAVEKHHDEMATLMFNHGIKNVSFDFGLLVPYRKLVIFVLKVSLPDIAQELRSNRPVDKTGHELLRLAAGFSTVDIAKELVMFGLKLNIENGPYETPLRIAIRRGNTEMIKLFAEHDVDP